VVPKYWPDEKRFPSEHTDRDGVKWALIAWDRYGSSADLWIVRRDGDKWVDPTFVGESCWAQRYAPGGGVTDEGAKREAELVQLVEGKGWVEKYLDKKKLKADSDGDGLPDTVEDWFGLDSASPDSDRDGRPDGSDANPLVAYHQPTDREAAMNAAFEAVTFFEPLGRNAFVEFPQAVTPFEISGAPGLVILTDSAIEKRPIFGYRFKFGYRGHEAVRMSADSQRAEVVLSESTSTWFVSWKVTVQRFGDEWFPIKVVTLSSGAA
jgi:hypothetical protein